MTTPDPRDPRGYAADAPLLEAWLRFTTDVRDGRALPFVELGEIASLAGRITEGDVHAGMKHRFCFVRNRRLDAHGPSANDFIHLVTGCQSGTETRLFAF